MKEKFKFYPTWTPGEPLALGDIGILDEIISLSEELH